MLLNAFVPSQRSIHMNLSMAAIVLLAKIIGPRVDIAMTPIRPQKGTSKTRVG